MTSNFSIQIRNTSAFRHSFYRSTTVNVQDGVTDMERYTMIICRLSDTLYILPSHPQNWLIHLLDWYALHVYSRGWVDTLRFPNLSTWLISQSVFMYSIDHLHYPFDLTTCPTSVRPKPHIAGCGACLHYANNAVKAKPRFSVDGAISSPWWHLYGRLASIGSNSRQVDCRRMVT